MLRNIMPPADYTVEQYLSKHDIYTFPNKIIFFGKKLLRENQKCAELLISSGEHQHRGDRED